MLGAVAEAGNQAQILHILSLHQNQGMYPVAAYAGIAAIKTERTSPPS